MPQTRTTRSCSRTSRPGHRILVVAVLFATSCSRAGAGDASKELAQLATQYWQAYLELHPVFATELGDRRFDARLSDNAPAGSAHERAVLEDFLRRAREIDGAALAPADRLTRTALVTELESGIAVLDCGMDTWVVDPLGGPQVSFFNIEPQQPVRTAQEGRDLVARWRAMGPYLDQEIANLRRGLADGKVAVHSQVERTIENLDETLARPDADWPLSHPLATPHPDWPAADRVAFETGVRTAVADVVRPALVRYRDVLRDEILPKARSNDEPGLVHVPGGLDCYRHLIRVHTSLDWSPEDVHALGLAEVARINRETEALGAKVFGISDRKAILAKLRTDPALYFETRDEVQAKAESALVRAKAAIPAWFGILPQADCVVVRMLPHEEKHSTIAYYRQPAADGSRPGNYVINTYAPTTRPRYEAEVLAYHESIPGHHLQIAIAQELGAIPEFRKHTGVTAFVEGWALYTERLADEMGLYSSDLDRLGMLSFDSWRACRLVVDSGMHAKGWTRQQAIDFMLENSALAENNIVNEVDRYITWPAQALAYKAGQLEILRLRGEARRTLGEAFDIKAFHDTVLDNGAVDLASLQQIVEQWIRACSTGTASRPR